MDAPLLVIGNKNYSSWSLRAWIGLRTLGVPFREHRVPLDLPDTAARIREHSPTGLVPALVDGDLVVYESIAILEYANEAYGDHRLLPGEMAARALARAACAEMHAGFGALRRELPMNLRRAPAPPRDPASPSPEARMNIARVLELWEGLLRQSGGPYLFGTQWSMADCMFLPVATRLRTYAVALEAHPASRAYVDAALALPAFREWEAAARAETETIAHEEA